MKRVIHVNQFKIRRNQKTGEREPVLTVKTYKSNDYAHEAVIRDAEGNEVARVVYSPDKPLSCGARVWIETQLDVELLVREESVREESEVKESESVKVRNDKGWLQCNQCGHGHWIHRTEVEIGDYEERGGCPHCGIGITTIDWSINR